MTVSGYEGIGEIDGSASLKPRDAETRGGLELDLGDES